MTKVSMFIMGGYIFLQILTIIFVWRCLRARFPEGARAKTFRWLWAFIYSALAATPVAATFLPEGPFGFAMARVGNIFLAFDTHFVTVFLIITFVSAGFRRLGKKKRRASLAALILGLVTALTVPVYGLVHAQRPVVSYRTADLRKGAGGGTTIRVALIADLHLGVNSRVKTAEKMVDLLNAQMPDLVLVAGDVFTSSYAALREPEKYAAVLSRIEAPMGTYAVYGNHDLEEKLFAGFAVRPVNEAFRTPEIERFFADSGFHVLTDEVVWLADGGLALAGRLDESKAGDGTANRKPVAELLQGIDRDAPLLVLEHEPTEYRELADAGADAVFSGHTHNGQIFPGNLYVKLVNENAYGQKNLFGMETFVTSGVGTFGPPMRTATNSEVMIIDLTY